jgi:hypothetical protein
MCNKEGSWKRQKQQLPCSSFLAEKMRKINKAGAKDYTDLDNLALSWTPNTAEKKVRPNDVDTLGIVVYVVL